MNDFGFLEKLIRLAIICIEETKFRVKTDNELSLPFSMDMGLKQGGLLSPVIFNLV